MQVVPPPQHENLTGFNSTYDGEQANLPDVCSLLVNIERWILYADYVRIPSSHG